MSRKRNPLADLNELARIKPDPLSTQRAIQRVQAALDEPSTARMPSFIQGAKLMSTRNLIAIAAAASVIFCITQWILSSPSGNFAFAQVREQVEKARSLQYVVTNKTKLIYDDEHSRKNDAADAAGILSFPAESASITRMKILGPDLMRVELSVSHAKSKEFEEMGIASSNTHITNFGERKEIMLYPEKKTYVIPQSKQPAETKSDAASRLDAMVSASSFAAKRPAAADLFSEVQVPDESMQKLPEKTVDGKKCVGFYLEMNSDTPHGKSTRKWTYWVEPSTKRPVRIERHWNGPLTGPRIAADGKSIETVAFGRRESDMVISDIVFDAPLDPALFSTDPPKGWTDLAAQSGKNPK